VNFATLSDPPRSSHQHLQVG